MASNLLTNGVYWGYNPLTTLSSNFLGHPSGSEIEIFEPNVSGDSSDQLINDQDPGYLLYIRDEILPSYMGDFH